MPARERSQGVTLDEAFARLDRVLGDSRLPSETVPVLEARGRVLATPVRSLLDLPPFDKAAMDGFAVPDRDTERYTIVATIAAGQPPAAWPLAPGEAVRVMTGAPVPGGTAEVVMQEDVHVHGNEAHVVRRRGRNVCPRGEDLRTGDLVLPAGHAMRALDVANVVACGVPRVAVVRRPRVALISTGDELCDDPRSLRPGQIMNSNGPLLEQLCAVHGLEAPSSTHVRDDQERIREALDQGLATGDLVVMTGGVSVGAFDLVPGALAELGLAVHVAGIAVKPGRPTTIASRGQQPVFGLPGNPAAAYLMFHLLVLRATARMSAAPIHTRISSLPLGATFERRHAERMEFLPATLNQQGEVVLVEYHGSAHLGGLTRADGFAVVQAGAQVIPAGERLEFWSFGNPTS